MIKKILRKLMILIKLIMYQLFTNLNMYDLRLYLNFFLKAGVKSQLFSVCNVSPNLSQTKRKLLNAPDQTCWISRFAAEIIKEENT